MAKDIQINIGADNAASQVLAKVSNDVDRFGSKSENAFAKATKSSQGFVVNLRSMAATITGGLIGKSIFDEFERIDEIAKTSRKLGLATEELIGLRFAAAELAGMAEGQVDVAMQRFTRRLADAAAGTGEAKAALEQLGLNAVALNAMGPAKAFKAVADAMQAVDGESDQLRIAFKLFDSEGASLVNVLNEGADAIDQMQEKARDLGLTFRDEVAAEVEATNDSIFELKKQMQGFARDIATSIAPELKTSAGLIRDALNFEVAVDENSASIGRWAQRFHQSVAVGIVEAFSGQRLAPVIDGNTVRSGLQNVVLESTGAAQERRDREMAKRVRDIQEDAAIDKLFENMDAAPLAFASPAELRQAFDARSQLQGMFAEFMALTGNAGQFQPTIDFLQQGGLRSLFASGQSALQGSGILDWIGGALFSGGGGNVQPAAQSVFAQGGRLLMGTGSTPMEKVAKAAEKSNEELKKANNRLQAIESSNNGIREAITSREFVEFLEVT